MTSEIQTVMLSTAQIKVKNILLILFHKPVRGRMFRSLLLVSFSIRSKQLLCLTTTTIVKWMVKAKTVNRNIQRNLSWLVGWLYGCSSG